MDASKGFLTRLSETFDEYRADRRRAQAEDTRPQSGRFRRFLRWLTPNGGTLLLVVALIATVQVWAKPLASSVSAPGPSATTVNYQGRLADSGGSPLDGSFGMSFSLWDAASDGSLVWGPENHTSVPVSQGLFSVGLGSLTGGGIPTTVWDGDRYLEITVGGETLSPRELIRSVPIAGMALTVPDGAIDTSHIADEAVGVDQIADGAVNNQHLALSHFVVNTTASDPIDLTSTAKVLGEMVIDVPYPANYIVFLYYAANGHGGRSVLDVRDADGATVCTIQHTSDGVLHTSRTCLFELPAGTHTFRLMAKNMSTDVGQVARGATHAIIIPMAQTP